MKSKSEKEVDNFISEFNKKYPSVKVVIIENSSSNFTINVGKITVEQKKYLIEGLEKIKQKYEEV